MQIPIVHGGAQIGELVTRREGAYTRFEARCALLPGVRRLYVFGGTQSAVLGVPRPEGGALVLRRRLSRAAMSAFPDVIEYAAFEPRRPAAPPRPERSARTEAGEAPFTFTEGGVRYLALPCALRRPVPGARLREIGGRSYLLFRC